MRKLVSMILVWDHSSVTSSGKLRSGFEVALFRGLLYSRLLFSTFLRSIRRIGWAMTMSCGLTTSTWMSESYPLVDIVSCLLYY